MTLYLTDCCRLSVMASLIVDGCKVHMSFPIIPETHFRYIKLGPGGAWAARSIANGEIHFGHKEVSHDLGLAGDRQAIVRHLIDLGRSPGKAADFTREILAFYTEPETTVWITFHGGCLWWAQAAADVHWLGDGVGHGARMRRTLGPWRDTDLTGNKLFASSLSTRLTKVEAYRQTICAVEASDYLRGRLNGEQLPLIARAHHAREVALEVAAALVATLHWTDFETLVDRLLARGGSEMTRRLILPSATACSRAAMTSRCQFGRNAVPP